MSKKTIKPIALAVSAAFATSAGVAVADASLFTATHLASGYMLDAGEAGNADSKAEEGKCGEGKCGGKEDKDKSAEGSCGEKKGEEGKCGEGKCGEDKGAEAKCGGDR